MSDLPVIFMLVALTLDRQNVYKLQRFFVTMTSRSLSSPHFNPYLHLNYIVFV